MRNATACGCMWVRDALLKSFGALLAPQHTSRSAHQCAEGSSCCTRAQPPWPCPLFLAPPAHEAVPPLIPCPPALFSPSCCQFHFRGRAQSFFVFLSLSASPPQTSPKCPHSFCLGSPRTPQVGERARPLWPCPPLSKKSALS